MNEEEIDLAAELANIITYDEFVKSIDSNFLLGILKEKELRWKE